MASSEKTGILKLNKWTSSDKPKRTDFIYDNQIIDGAVGVHVNNSVIHLTSSEKIKLTQGYVMYSFAGDGEPTYTYTFDFEPKMVYIFQKNTPSVTYNSNKNCMVVHSGLSIAEYIGEQPGIQLNKNKLILSQCSTPEDGVIYNLNEEYGQYVIVAFR